MTHKRAGYESCFSGDDMRLFACPSCGLVVFFGNVRCERCEARLGYNAEANRMIALAPDASARPYCANFEHGAR